MVKKKKSLGYGFPDEVAKVTFKNSKFSKAPTDEWKDTLLPHFSSASSEKPGSSWLQTLFYIAALGLFFAICLRLFHLQILWGKQNRELADGNRIQVKVIHAPRGVIFDRNGKVLAANAPAFRLVDRPKKTFRLISREEALELEVNKNAQATDLEVDNVRTYPLGEKTAHLLGYVGEISEDQLKKAQFNGYKLGDSVGQSGIEAQYEKILRGKDGGEIIEVDSQGRMVRQLRVNPPVSGQNIYLNIDSELQQKIYDEMASTLKKLGVCCGAAAAVNPQTGEVLALLSFPSFDPNVFTKNRDDNTIAEIFSRSDSPILDRAIGGTYPPGSTFKIVSALAALESGKMTADSVVYDNGYVDLGPFRFTNWYFTGYGKTEGAVDLVKAIKRSNDIYFYQVGQTIGEEVLGNFAKKLMLGAKLGIDLPGEVSGLIPDNNWKQKTFNQPWYPGDTLHMAIGQGFVLTTPLQILGITSFMAADGILYRPQLVQKIVSGDETTWISKPQVLLSNLVSPKFLEPVKEGLSEVPKEGGTAWPFFTFPITTAGKTGTAEFGDPKGRTHAWYTSFAPLDDPKIAMTVLIEAGGEGSNEAAPIVKEAYRWYLSADKNHLIKDIYPLATSSAKQFGE